MSIFPKNCARCGCDTTQQYTMSFFNLDKICLDCSNEEEGSPNFIKAQAIARDRASNGDLNFPGIGLSSKDEIYILKRKNERLIKNTQRHDEHIFENKIDNHQIAPIIIDINEELKRYLAKHPDKIYDLSPRKFEELIAEILSDFGFHVELTPATRDGGKDIYAYIKNQICSFLMFVECKKWTQTKHVGIEVVQRLYGVQQINKANKSMVVTTSFFTKPAIEESKRYESLISLHDYNDLKTWLKRYEEEA